MNRLTLIAGIIAILGVLLFAIYIFSSQITTNKVIEPSQSRLLSTDATQPDNPKVTPLTKQLELVVENDINRFADKSTEGLEEEVEENGASKVHLKGKFLNVPVATIGSDGKITIKEYATKKVNEVSKN